MNRHFRSARTSIGAIALFGMASAASAETPAVTQIDWETRTAACPGKVTQSTNLVFRITDVNDMLIDFATGERATYRFRAKGTPVSVVPPSNFALQTGQGLAACPVNGATLSRQLNAIRGLKDPLITPPVGGPSVSLRETINTARSHIEVTTIETEYANDSCKTLFDAVATDPVVDWIARLRAAGHDVDLKVNLEPNLNYRFTLDEMWKGQTTRGGHLDWYCGESDVLTLSAGPLISSLENRTYAKQQVPTGDGTTTQNQLVVSGTGPNILGAALLNYHLPLPAGWPDWTGLAFSVGPVYTLGNAVGVSHLGLFLGVSAHLNRSVFITPGIHIGEFADFPAGFHSGSPIPSGFGDLAPTKRTATTFAIGVTFKTTTFKKTANDGGTAKSGSGAADATDAAADPKKKQPVSGTKGAGATPPSVPMAKEKKGGSAF